MTKLIYQTQKTFTHSQGISCAFRNWRDDGHCALIHGYALQFGVLYEAKELDERNWVQDFGGLAKLRDWVKASFDHKMLVAKDDPMMHIFGLLHHTYHLADVKIVPAIGLEKFAEYVFNAAEGFVEDKKRVKVRAVTCEEHPSNLARVIAVDDPINPQPKKWWQLW